MYGRDPERTYKERRFRIRQSLPSLSGFDLLKCINELNEEISSLKKETEELEGWVKRIKREGNVEVYLDGMHRTLTDSNLGMLELHLGSNATALKWMQREKKIYAWELRVRKAKSVKVPALKLQRASLNKKAHELLYKMRSLSGELARLCADHRNACSEYYRLEREIALLSFEREEPSGGKVWTGFSAPDPNDALKAFAFLKGLELKQEGKATGLRKLLRI